MKKIYAILTIAVCSLVFNFTLSAASSASIPEKPAAEAQAALAVESAKADWDNLSRKEKRHERKRLRTEIKQAVEEWKAAGSDAETLLLVIVAILLPPLAMLIYDGLTGRFWLSLLLTLLFYLPGLIYTLVVILGGK